MKNRPGSMCIHAACAGDETLTEVVFHSEERFCFPEFKCVMILNEDMKAVN